LRAQQGVSLLIPVLLIIAIAVFGAVVLGNISARDVTDSAGQGDSVQALYSAESGIARALKQFSTGTAACGAGLSAANIAVGPGTTFTTSAGLTTDFTGVAGTLPNSQCRVQVVGGVTGTANQRKLQAILDRNLLAGTNPGVNYPTGAGLAATSWTATASNGTTWGAFDYTGGPEPVAAAPTACSRALYAVKADNGAANFGSSLGTATVTPNFTVTGGQTITVRFNYRAVLLSISGSGACDIQDGFVPNPGSANDVQIFFAVLDSGGTYSCSGGSGNCAPIVPLAFNIAAGNTVAASVTTGNSCRPSTVQFPARYANCSSFYQAGTPTNKGQSTITVQGGGPRTIPTFYAGVYLQASGTAREVWVDNIELIANSGLGVARTAEWRDCAISACP